MEGTVTTVPNLRADLEKSLAVPKRPMIRKATWACLL